MTFSKQPVRISVAMVIDQLREQCDIVSTHRAALSKAIESRNDMLIELKAAGVPERSLMRLTGLSRDSVKVITANARRTPQALDLERATGSAI